MSEPTGRPRGALVPGPATPGQPPRPARGSASGSPASAERIAHGRAAFLWACGLDVAVRKPGNVSVYSAGHAMEAEQFLASARASVDPLFAPGLGVGARIEGAVAATRAAVGCNTNLGILLLCAPLAAALERAPLDGDAEALRAACAAVLEALDVADASAAYRAIAHANPGGLGHAEAQDVATAPTVDLRAAMTLAADRDSIARQYTSAYADVFGAGLAAMAGGATLAAVVQQVFLAFLAGWPDSHIVRKLGAAVAQTVTEEAAVRLARQGVESGIDAAADLAAWDEGLKAKGINPGTSADLTVCTLFAAALLCPQLVGTLPATGWHGLCIQSRGIGLLPTSE